MKPGHFISDKIACCIRSTCASESALDAHESSRKCRASVHIMKSKIYTERQKKRRVNFIPKFHSSLNKFVKYFTMITKRYMYGTKVPNFIGLCSTSLELLKFIGSYAPNLEIKIKLKISIGCVHTPPPPPPPLWLPLLP